ncbi:hypothetical protein AKO1_001004 [Acrasis kona]|uniref:Uncharacterized protein n=1 Tax=Acrasis kona TaxID=1008807 RepID=A0AAW2ZCP9_9EUKA
MSGSKADPIIINDELCMFVPKTPNKPPRAVFQKIQAKAKKKEKFQQITLTQMPGAEVIRAADVSAEKCLQEFGFTSPPKNNLDALDF